VLRRLSISLACLASACAFAGSAAAASTTRSSHTARSTHSKHARRASCTRLENRRSRHEGRRAQRRHNQRCRRQRRYVARTAGHRGSNLSFSGPASWSTFSNHTETWAYDDCANGGSNASSSEVRSWVNYAEANCGPGGDAKTLTDCHANGTVFCNVIQYLDTNWIYPNGSPPWKPFSQAASSSWYQHTPGSQTNRILSKGYGGGFLIDQNNSGVRSFFHDYARSNYNNVDGLMMDDQSSSLSTQLYYSSCGCSSSNEVASTPALRAAHEGMSSVMTHTNGQHFLQVDNTLPPNPNLPQGLDMLSRSSGTHGLITEGAPEDNGTLDPFYSTLLDQIAYVANRTDSFVVPLSYGDAGASSEARSRLVQEGTMLLGYSPGHLVDWADLEQNTNNLAVWPEEGIYPTRPLESMSAPGGSGCLAGNGNVCSTGGHTDLQVAPGVYRREFGSCYDKGIQFGACASIVNTTSSPVTISGSWLKHSYGHVITLNGGDVQSGGSVDLNGSAFRPGSTTVAPQDATLLAA
jgi:hypothetical protein